MDKDLLADKEVTAEYKLWVLFLQMIRDKSVREELRRALQKSPAHALSVIERCIGSALRKIARPREIPALLDSALYHAETMLQGDLQVQDVPGKGLGLVAMRKFEATVEDLARQHEVVGFIEVLSEEQYIKAIERGHSSIIDNNGFTGLLGGKLALCNHVNGANFRFRTVSAADPPRGQFKRVQLTNSHPHKVYAFNKGEELLINYGPQFRTKCKFSDCK